MLLYVIFTTACAYWVYRYVVFWRHIEKIPGPKGLPIIGIFSLLLRSRVELFKQDLDFAKKFPNIYKVSGAGIAAVVLSNPEDVEKVLTDSSNNTKNDIYKNLEPWLGTGLLTSSGQKWQKRRKMLTPAFHFNILQEFVNVFNKETKQLIELLEKRCHEDSIDVVGPITQFTLQSIAETAMAVDLSEDLRTNKSYKQAVQEMGELVINKATKIWLRFSPIFYLSGVQKLQEQIVDILHTFSRNVIEERKKLYDKTPQNDIKHEDLSYSTRKRMAMLDLLLKHQKENHDIDDEGIREEVDTFMFEGHDTTSLAICYILMMLANHKEAQDEIYREIVGVLGYDPRQFPSLTELSELKFMERCVKECLRLYPSVPNIARILGKDFTSKTGYYIPESTNVHVHIYSLHRNPEVYEQPDKFNPDRFLGENVSKRHPFAYIPFSAGPRNCIGQRYAMAELKSVLCGILRKFKLEPVDTPDTIVIKADLVLRPDTPIRVKFVKRS